MILRHGVQSWKAISMNIEIALFFIELTAFFITVVKIATVLSVRMAKVEFRLDSIERIDNKKGG
jgi:hypothetical protein